MCNYIEMIFIEGHKRCSEEEVSHSVAKNLDVPTLASSSSRNDAKKYHLKPQMIRY